MLNSKRLFGLLGGILISSFLLVSCRSQTDDEWKFSEKVSREMKPDGWVYSFEYQYLKNGEQSDTLVPYIFSGINLRYRYPINGSNTNGEIRKIQTLDSVSENMKQDVNKLNAYLNDAETKTPQELLSSLLDGVEFVELDKPLIENLIRTALTSEPHPEGNRPDTPRYGLKEEQAFLDGYKFQIGWLAAVGCIDIVYIDVLLEDQAASHGYIQLSDLIENGLASEDQKQAFELISNIQTGIIEHNDFKYGGESYQTTICDTIDFSRLYTFLNDIDERYG